MLSSTVQTALITIAGVCALAAAGGISINLPSAGAGQPQGTKSRILLFLASLALGTFAVVNPGHNSFKVTGADIFAQPSGYAGTCPLTINLIGRIEASNGDHKVLTDLYLGARGSLVGGSGIQDSVLGDGDTVERTVVVNQTNHYRASFVVLAPQRLQDFYVLPVRCSSPRRKPR